MSAKPERDEEKMLADIKEATALFHARVEAARRILPEPEWKPLDYSYDPSTDVITIEGIEYSGGLFKGLGLCEVGTVLEIVKREDGVLTVTNHHSIQEMLKCIRTTASRA